jgi:hypothetical protein
MTVKNLSNISSAAPSPSLSPALQALWWLKKGGLAMGAEWEKAHVICQTKEGERDHDLVHALAHWIEGDVGNAEYWYARAHEKRGSDIESEWTRIVGVLTA